MEPLTIQRMADLSGLSVHTLRYYEKTGLIHAVERDSSGYRRYSPTDVDWVRFLLRLRTLGMPISEMKRYSDLRYEGDATAAARMELLQKHKRKVEERIRELSGHLEKLEDKIDYYKGMRMTTAASIQLDSLDHFVLTVSDLQATVRFYAEVLGMEPVQFAGGRYALNFGRQKINLHEKGKEFEPKAHAPLPGTADLCFIAHTPVAEIMRILKQRGIAVEEGPVRRTGALGPIESVYFRDPDLNLIEVSNYAEV